MGKGRKTPKGIGKQYGYGNNTPKAVRESEAKTKQNAERGEFSFDVINGLALKETVYKMPPKPKREAMRDNFKKEARPAFLKYLAEHKEAELRAIGVSDTGLALMRKGMSANGFNVHHKLPIHGGGTNDFTNLILMPVKQHDELHHIVIDPQIKNIAEIKSGKTIKLPWTDDMVWKRPAQAREKLNTATSQQDIAAKPTAVSQTSAQPPPAYKLMQQRNGR